MTGKKLKVGVIGVGSLGQWHARVYSELKNVELAGVYDIDKKRAEEIAERYNTKAYTSIESLIPEIEAASVVVPAHKHHEAACFLMEHDIHLLVEKPIAVTTTQAEEMAALAEQRNLILQVGHVERFNPVMKSLEKVLTNPRFIEAHRLAPYPPARPGTHPRGTEVSVVLDLMIHDLEVILHLVKSPVREIRAVGVHILSASENICNVRLLYECGCVANVTTSRVSPEQMRKIRIFQEDAYISLDYQNQAGKIFRKGFMRIDKKDVEVEKGDALENELASFVECVRRKGEPVVDGRQAVNALKLAVEICRSIREGAS
ncbi:MAG: Gfo/Idh/MocA family oxidoreductase [Lentisphaerae bacterium]|nr:Gfo/Idh/MocA family oxidoreductase [Lentisphaerota bacterium]